MGIEVIKVNSQSLDAKERMKKILEEHKVSRKKEYIWLLLPSIIVLFFLSIFPLIYAFSISFRDYSFATGRVDHVFYGIKNWIYILKNPDFYNSLFVTFKFSIISVTIEMILGMVLALLFNQKNYKLKPLNILIVLPMAISPVIVGLVFRWFYSGEIGIIGYIIQSIGLTPPSWYQNATNAMFAVVIADVWEWTPFVFLICLAGLQLIQNEFYEAAEVDGASNWHKFRYITLPLLRNTLIVIFVLRAIPALKEFDKVFIITAGGPGTSTVTTSLFVYKQMIYYNNMATAVVGALILVIIIIIISQVLFNYLRRHEDW